METASSPLINVPERRYSWPESTEKRMLRCNLLESERRDYGHEQSELIQEVDQLEEQKKASASHYKALIEEKGARARRIAGYITSGWREKDVQCEWYYECSGCPVIASTIPRRRPSSAWTRLRSSRFATSLRKSGR